MLGDLLGDVIWPLGPPRDPYDKFVHNMPMDMDMLSAKNVGVQTPPPPYDSQNLNFLVPPYVSQHQHLANPFWQYVTPSKKGIFTPKKNI